MRSYLTTLTFNVCFAECSHTEGQHPPGTPEAIVGDAKNLMTLNVLNELGRHREYVAESTTEAETSDGLGEDMKSLFDHLPGFEATSLITETVQADMPKFTLCCQFRSGVPFETLKAGFAKYVAVGNLVGNGTVPHEYVAHVEIEAELPDGLTDAVDKLLRKAFGADTEESALDFKPINTTLVE